MVHGEATISQSGTASAAYRACLSLYQCLFEIVWTVSLYKRTYFLLPSIDFLIACSFVYETNPSRAAKPWLRFLSQFLPKIGFSARYVMTNGRITVNYEVEWEWQRLQHAVRGDVTATWRHLRFDLLFVLYLIIYLWFIYLWFIYSWFIYLWFIHLYMVIYLFISGLYICCLFLCGFFIYLYFYGLFIHLLGIYLLFVAYLLFCILWFIDLFIFYLIICDLFIYGLF